MQSSGPSQAQRRFASVELPVVAHEERSTPTMSLEALGVIQSLDGYLRTLLPDNEVVSGAPRLDAASSLKRPHAQTSTEATSRKAPMYQTPSSDSVVLAQLAGQNKIPRSIARTRLPQARPALREPTFKLSAARERLIDDALASTLDGSPLGKPVFWPHFEVMVDIRTLRKAYPEYADKPNAEIAHALGGMVDYDLQGFAELWRQRHALSATHFMRLATPHLTCPISHDFFADPILTLEGRNVSLDELARYYAPGPRPLFGGAPALGSSIYGYPNRRLAAITRALTLSDEEFMRPEVHQGFGLWEVGALFREFAAHLMDGAYDVNWGPEISIGAAARKPRREDPALSEDLRALERINSVTQMVTDAGVANVRGELLRRAVLANQLLFRQLTFLVQDLSDGKGIHAGRVRLAADAALINAPVHATPEHFMSNQAPFLIAALRHSNDLGSITRRIFFEQTVLRNRRDQVAERLRPIDIQWLRKYDRQALTYLQMSWHPILHPAPVCRKRWEPSSANDKLDSLAYALWVDIRDLNFKTLFLPYEDVTALAADLSLSAWEKEQFAGPDPMLQTMYALGPSRTPSVSSTHSLRLHLEEVAGGGSVIDTGPRRTNSSSSRGRSPRSAITPRSARQSCESLLAPPGATPSGERKITF